MSFLEHLEELRTRLIYICVALFIGVLIGLWFSKPVNQFLIQPFIDSGLIEVARSDDRPEPISLTVDRDGIAKIDLSNIMGADSNTSATEPVQIAQLDFYQEGQTTPFASLKAAPNKSGLGYFRPLDPFVVYFKTALIIGIIICTPMIAYQTYGFVAPGLYEREKKAVIPLFFAAAILFPVGAAFAYFMLKYFIYFLASYSIPDVLVFNDIRAYLNFVLTMIIVFGILFELPVVIVLLTKLGIVTPDQLAQKRKFMFVGILVVAAAFTPGGEPLSMLVLSLPLYLLFESALIFSRIGAAKKAQEEREENSQELDE